MGDVCYHVCQRDDYRTDVVGQKCKTTVVSRFLGLGSTCTDMYGPVYDKAQYYTVMTPLHTSNDTRVSVYPGRDGSNRIYLAETESMNNRLNPVLPITFKKYAAIVDKQESIDKTHAKIDAVIRGK